MLTVAILLAITALCWGLSPILEKMGLAKVDPLIAITIRSFAISIVLAVIMTVTGRIKDLIAVDTKGLLIFASSGILAGLLGMWTYFAVLKLQPVSRIIPIVAAYPLITVVLSLLILKEGVTLAHILGTVLIIAGIWFVKGGA